jgi:hypothetical protein
VKIFIIKKKAILEDQAFFWSPTAEQFSKFPSGFRLKIFTWDPKVQLKRLK